MTNKQNFKITSTLCSILLLVFVMSSVSFMAYAQFVSISDQKTTRASVLTAHGPLRKNNLYWGAAGHRDQGGPYASIPLSRQITDLKAVFGSVPNTVVYRALGDGMATGYGTDVLQLQAAGIIPIVMVVTYPPWEHLPNELAAFSWAYKRVSRSVRSAPTNQVWEIGNEWILQAIWSHRSRGESDLSISDWKSARIYPLYRGVMAGAVAAIRDKGLPSAQILGSVLGGWTFQNLAVALASDLANYNGRNLTWDITVEHWYDDVKTDGNKMGSPDNFNGGLSVYKLQKSVQKPIFFTEFGSSNGDDPSLSSSAGQHITGLMENFFAHRKTTVSEPGVLGGIVYMLYQMPGVQTDYFLYNYSGGSNSTLSVQGKAVKSWIASHVHH